MFDEPRKIRWFVECPMSIFLCVVTKAESRIRIYQTSPRFYAWTHLSLPRRLELIPEEGTEGRATGWKDGTSFSLGAPILDFPLTRINCDPEFRDEAAGILGFWIGVDERNLGFVRLNLRKFEMPSSYQTNVLPPGGRIIHGRLKTSAEDLDRASSQLREPLDGVTDQLFRHGDLLAAVRGLLMLRQLYGADYHAPLALGNHSNVFNTLLGKDPAEYLYEGLDAIGNLIDVRLLQGLKDGQLLARVQQVRLRGRDVTDDVIAALRHAGELRVLHLGDTRVTDDGLRHLKALRKLRELSLSHTKITDSTLRSLRGLAELILLNLARTRVSGAGMAHIGRLKRLENLYLDGTKVDDEGLRHVGKLPHLEVLTLDGTRVTDKGLAYLRRLGRLRKLFRARTRITDGAAAELMRVLPGLSIIPPPSPQGQRVLL
jgi:hypothetical protein